MGIKLFVFTPAGEKVELNTKYEVVADKLFADLPEENELVIYQMTSSCFAVIV